MIEYDNRRIQDRPVDAPNTIVIPNPDSEIINLMLWAHNEKKVLLHRDHVGRRRNFYIESVTRSVVDGNTIELEVVYEDDAS